MLFEISGDQRLVGIARMAADSDLLETKRRVEYFEKEKPNPHFLSEAARASDDAAHLVITRRKNAFLMMNRYPYSVGHLMAVPYRKTADAASLGENEVLELWNLAVHGQVLLRETMKAQGFNIGMNLGGCAGAGVPDQEARRLQDEIHRGNALIAIHPRDANEARRGADDQQYSHDPHEKLQRQWVPLCHYLPSSIFRPRFGS